MPSSFTTINIAAWARINLNFHTGPVIFTKCFILDMFLYLWLPLSSVSSVPRGEQVEQPPVSSVHTVHLSWSEIYNPHTDHWNLYAHKLFVKLYRLTRAADSLRAVQPPPPGSGGEAAPPRATTTAGCCLGGPPLRPPPPLPDRLLALAHTATAHQRGGEERGGDEGEW